MDSPNTACLPYLKALSDDTRWQIVKTLIAAGSPLTLSELADRLEISKYKASRHVSVLDEVGILTTERRGRKKLLCVTRECHEQISSGVTQTDILNLGCCSFEFPDPGSS